PVTKEDALDVIRRVERWQKEIFEETGSHFVHASDEFYHLAGLDMPEEARYDGYIQLENGVGMLRLLETEIKEALKEKEETEKGEVSIATGRLAFPYIQEYIKPILERYPGRQVHIYPITNDFFGEMITVSGLITGRDLIGQLKGRALGDWLLLPVNMFRSGEEIFLDDVTLQEAEKALQVRIRIVQSSGRDLVSAILHPEQEPQAEEGSGLPGAAYGYEGYELDSEDFK
ncbi:MAG TPA: DUF512 domain-containing protein, partial [Candidatus Enterocloster faecavium]|nr:DUF512 domain-containing protein [Candidatus Enterocloster faecavium]